MREGFWSTGEGSNLPLPTAVAGHWSGRERFLGALHSVEAKAGAAAFKGSSRCRICGGQNGSREFRWNGWRWPEGYLHYVEDHGVRPSLAFEEFILGIELE